MFCSRSAKGSFSYITL